MIQLPREHVLYLLVAKRGRFCMCLEGTTNVSTEGNLLLLTLRATTGYIKRITISGN